ncbi:hypothetical protein D3C75_621460 [compost metagenome]
MVRQSLSHFVFDVQTVLVVSILHRFDGPASLQLTGTSFNDLVDNFHGHTTTTGAFQSTARTTDVATVKSREASLCASSATSVVDQSASTVYADQTWSTWAYTARTSCEASVCAWSVTSCNGVSTKTTGVETVDWVGSEVVVVVTEGFRIACDCLNAVGTFVSVLQTQRIDLGYWTLHWLYTNQFSCDGARDDTTDNWQQDLTETSDVSSGSRTTSSVFSQHQFLLVFQQRSNDSSLAGVQTFQQTSFGIAPLGVEHFVNVHYVGFS